MGCRLFISHHQSELKLSYRDNIKHCDNLNYLLNYKAPDCRNRFLIIAFKAAGFTGLDIIL